MTKLRFIVEYGRKEYIDEMEYIDCVTMLKLRLNVVETKCNYKGKFPIDQKCEICHEEQDTTEHLLKCTSFVDQRIKMKKEELDVLNPNANLTKYIRKTVKNRDDMGFSIKFGIEEE